MFYWIILKNEFLVDDELIVMEVDGKYLKKEKKNGVREEKVKNWWFEVENWWFEVEIRLR